MLITVALVISHSYPYLKANNITRQNPSVGLGSLKNLTTLSIDAEKCARLTRNALKWRSQKSETFKERKKKKKVGFQTGLPNAPVPEPHKNDIHGKKNSMLSICLQNSVRHKWMWPGFWIGSRMRSQVDSSSTVWMTPPIGFQRALICLNDLFSSRSPLH